MVGKGETPSCGAERFESNPDGFLIGSNVYCAVPKRDGGVCSRMYTVVDRGNGKELDPVLESPGCAVALGTAVTISEVTTKGEYL